MIAVYFQTLSSTDHMPYIEQFLQPRKHNACLSDSNLPALTFSVKCFLAFVLLISTESERRDLRPVSVTSSTASFSFHSIFIPSVQSSISSSWPTVYKDSNCQQLSAISFSPSICKREWVISDFKSSTGCAVQELIGSAKKLHLVFHWHRTRSSKAAYNNSVPVYILLFCSLLVRRWIHQFRRVISMLYFI